MTTDREDSSFVFGWSGFRMYVTSTYSNGIICLRCLVQLIIHLHCAMQSSFRPDLSLPASPPRRSFIQNKIISCSPQGSGIWICQACAYIVANCTKKQQEMLKLDKVIPGATKGSWFAWAFTTGVHYNVHTVQPMASAGCDHQKIKCCSCSALFDCQPIVLSASRMYVACWAVPQAASVSWLAYCGWKSLMHKVAAPSSITAYRPPKGGAS